MIRCMPMLAGALWISTLAASIATAAPAPEAVEPAAVCDEAAIDKVKAANRAALKSLLLTQYVEAATRADASLTLAAKLGCGKHAVTGWAYLFRGAAEHRSGRVRRAFADWQRALKLNPRIFMPPQISDRTLHREFNVLKRQLRRRSGAPGRPSAAHGKRCLEDTECRMGYVCHLGRCMHPRLAGRRARAAPAGPGARPASAPARARRYADSGSYELMGSFGFSYVTVDVENSGIETFSVDVSAYVGYFVVKGFSLGVYLGVPYTESRPNDSSVGTTVRSVGFDVAVAPGAAFALSTRAFLYITGMIGLAVYGEDSALAETNGVLGLFGGELGLKLRIGGSTLMSLGFRPNYVLGKVKTDTGLGSDKADFKSLRLYVILGFSFFGV